MSKRTNPEDRVRDAMHAYTEPVEPAPDAWARIRERVDRPTARSRRARAWQVSLAGFAAAAAVVLLVVGLVALRSENDDGDPGIAGPRVSTAPTEATGKDRREPLPNFVAVRADGRVVVITNADGRERELADGADAATTLAVTPDGKGVYFDRLGSASSECGPNREIVFVSTKGGKTRAIAENAADPAVSPNGKRLAYVEYAGSSGCLNPKSLVVQRVTSDSGRSWTVRFENEVVFAPSWAPDSRHVGFAVTGGDGLTTYHVLDANTAGSLADAEPVPLEPFTRVYGYFGYSDALLGAATTDTSSMVVIDPATGAIAKVLFPIGDDPVPFAAAASPRGQNVLYLGLAASAGGGLYVWQEVAPTPVAFTEGILAATFLPVDRER